MRFSTILPMLLAANVAYAQVKGGQGKQNGQNNNQNKGQNNNAAANNNNNNNNNANNNANNNKLALDPANVQSNSDKTGQEAGAEAGQAASATDPANFINFCSKKTLTNGLQVKGGSCNGIVMGDMPASTKMVSAIITNPKDGSTIQANSPITFSVQIANLQAGTFTNPDTTYYAAPQSLNGQGQVIGHTHITVQDLGGQKQPAAALPADTFAFFKGINDAGNGKGLLSANLTAGLPNGVYRVCSMTSAANHQPVLMPVAQRGAQDDCIRFTVGGNGGNNNANNNNNNNANNANNANNNNANKGQAANNANANKGQAANNANANKGAAAQKGAQGQAQGKGQAQQKGRGRMARPKFAARDFIA